MLASDRRSQILAYVREEGSARVRELSRMFNVTEPTIRQDLELLEAEGHIRREHGGALLKDVDDQVSRLALQHSENMALKRRIAARALDLVTDGMSMILDSGSTTTELARLLKRHSDLRVVTNAVNIALLLGSSFSIDVLVTGGEFKPPTLSLSGDRAAEFFDGLTVDVLFLATGGVSPRYELTYPSLSDLSVKSAMLRSARRRVLLCDSTKFGRSDFATLAAIDCVDLVVTDDGISEAERAAVEKRGIELLLA